MSACGAQIDLIASLGSTSACIRSIRPDNGRIVSRSPFVCRVADGLAERM